MLTTGLVVIFHNYLKGRKTKNSITLFREHLLRTLLKRKIIILEQEIKNVINAFLVVENDLSLMDVNLE